MVSHPFYVDDSLIFFRAIKCDYLSVKSILSIYESASGQVVNYGKSMFMTSQNKNRDIQELFIRS